jgi:SAM-dependent methyltransferase
LLAQPDELQFHKTNKWRQSEDFMNQTISLLKFWGYKSDDFADQLIADLGAGSKLRSKFFQRARIIAIEPLANEFIRSIDWTDLNDAYRVYACPAETELTELAGQIHFLMCINVLDHVYDYKKILQNVSKMLKPKGEFLLSVDLHTNGKVDPMHPVNLDEDCLKRSLLASGLKIVREYRGLPLPHSNTYNKYGPGEAYTVVARKLFSP